MDVFELTKALVGIPSPTGSEGAVAAYLSAYLKSLGLDVREQEVEPGRINLFASRSARPTITFCTHMDTVPGHIPASEDSAFIYGRGACDAKGIIAALITAASGLNREGIKEFGLLFVVGEETDSLGAKMANSLGIKSKFLIVGEPTENKLGRGHKGVLTIRLAAKGRRAHSAFPELGESAVEKLLDGLAGLRRLDMGEDPVLGRNLMNIGQIEGGTAANVIPDSAWAIVSFRTSVAPETILDLAGRAIGPGVKIEVITKSQPQVLFTVPGFEEAVLPYGSDIPYLSSFGKPLLIGPGSALDAHTEGEKIEKKKLLDAVEIYMKLTRRLLAER
jgi:acetylornithine deacetylase